MLSIYFTERQNTMSSADCPSSTCEGVQFLFRSQFVPNLCESGSGVALKISNETRDFLSNSNWIATGCKSRDHLTAEFSGGAKAMTGAETLACRGNASV